jgi:hypothetical protein
MAFGRVGALGGGFGRIGAGGKVSAVPAGGALLLTGETSGFAADFTYATDAQRVAKKTAGAIVYSGTSFFTSSGASSKWVYDINGVLVNIPAGTLPLDYDPVTHAARGLLCEPAATNLMLRNQAFDDAAWIPSGVTVVANQAVAPDGTTTMDKIYPASSGSNKWIGQAMGASVATYTHSVFAKMAGKRWLYLLMFDGSNYAGWFDLQTGVVGGLGAGYSSAIRDVGNGIYRCSVTGPGVASFSNQAGVSDANGSAAVTVNATDGIYLWGSQVELGSVATSYIPTLGATVTRAVDSYNCTAASIGNSGTAGSWWAEMNHNIVLAGTPRIIGTAGAASPLYYTAATTPGMLDTTGLTKTTTTIVGSTHKVWSAFASGDRAFTADGLAAATDAGATSGLLAPVTLYLGSGGSAPMNGYLRKVRYLPRRPTNAEGATMTT